MTSGSASGSVSTRSPHFLTEKIIGASHIRSGKPCQDETGSLVVGDVVVVAVADGHGSSRFADVGARLAVQVALTNLVRFAEEVGHRGASIGEVQKFATHPLRVQVVREWAERVRASAGRSDAALIDYGSTLIFAMVTPEFLLVGQLGDGDVLLVGPDGQVSVVIPADPRAFADETPSLCLPEAWHSLRVRVFPAPQEESLLLLSTDGYSKSYASDDVFRQIGPDYLELVREEGMRGLATDIRGFLKQVTTEGSGDDIAIALLYWPPLAIDAEAEGPIAEAPSEIADVATSVSVPVAPVGTVPVDEDPCPPVPPDVASLGVAALRTPSPETPPFEPESVELAIPLEFDSRLESDSVDNSSILMEKSDERVPEDE